jgi:hypothetical protein
MQKKKKTTNMTKKALLFGLNYINDASASLAGCINDAKNLQALLKDHMGYRSQDIMLCTDETDLKPTKSVILRLIRELCLWTHRQQVHQIFISYSGHGTFQADSSGDESDNTDECLVPLDFQMNGVVTDDELGMLIRQVHPRTDVVFLIDACHSGSAVDFPYRYVSGNKYAIESDSSVPCRAIMISGCKDVQTSQEVWSFQNSKQVSGLMTSSFIHALEHHNYDLTCWALIRFMQHFITSLGYEQKPQLCTTRKLTETCIFISNNINGKPFFMHEE